MRPDHPLLKWPTIAGVAVAASIVFLLVGGPKAGLGFALGTIGSGASVLGTWLLVRLAGESASGRNPGPLETFLSLTGFFFKWVVVVATMWSVYRLGPPAPGCFLAGMGLVYSRLIAQALVRV